MKDKNEETTTASQPARWHREDARFKAREERRKRGRRGRKITNAHTHTQTTGTIFLEGKEGRKVRGGEERKKK